MLQSHIFNQQISILQVRSLVFTHFSFCMHFIKAPNLPQMMATTSGLQQRLCTQKSKWKCVWVIFEILPYTHCLLIFILLLDTLSLLEVERLIATVWSFMDLGNCLKILMLVSLNTKWAKSCLTYPLYERDLCMWRVGWIWKCFSFFFF